MEMKSSLSTSADHMQDLHSEHHHHHHQSNLPLTPPGYEKHASHTNSTNKSRVLMLCGVEVAHESADHALRACFNADFFIT